MSKKAILVTGSREWDDRLKLQEAIWAEQMGGDEFHLFVGDCPTGADEMAASFWRRWIEHWLGDEITVFVADGETHGKAAGPKRNKEMVEAVVSGFAIEDITVLAFFKKNAGNRGTTNCVAAALAAGIPDGQIKRFWA